MSSWNVTKTRTKYRLINGYYKFSMKLVGDELETIYRPNGKRQQAFPWTPAPRIYLTSVFPHTGSALP